MNEKKLAKAFVNEAGKAIDIFIRAFLIYLILFAVVFIPGMWLTYKIGLDGFWVIVAWTIVALLIARILGRLIEGKMDRKNNSTKAEFQLDIMQFQSKKQVRDMQ